MAGFKAHTIAGLGVAAFTSIYAFIAGTPTASQLFCLASMSVFGGILPDLDSDTGRPVKLLFLITSFLVVILATSYLLSREVRAGAVLSLVAIIYILWLLFFLICKRLTVHRGIMHSIPFAFLVSSLAALTTTPWGQSISYLAGLTFFCGIVSHLVLDELNSLGFRFGIIPYFKQSFGSALKLSSKSLTATVTVYAMAVVISTLYLSAR